MPVWTVQIVDGEDEKVEAGLLATEGGALIALSQEGLVLRAWAPGQWRTARHVGAANTSAMGGVDDSEDVLIGLPRR